MIYTCDPADTPEIAPSTWREKFLKKSVKIGPMGFVGGLKRRATSSLSHFKSKIRDIQGQASILMGTMIVTFLLFFAFVVNTGMLVNAKINLQNAADLAAYAGAAVQARQLNNISYLNYEMRRQFKKFLFRYYVLGTMYFGDFPSQNAGGGGRLYKPARDGRAFGVPAVCFFLLPGSNHCQIKELGSVARGMSGFNPGDAISQTLKMQLEAIEALRKQDCVASGKINTALLTSWLLNTDPSVDSLIQALQSSDPENSKLIGRIKALATGLGLIPRELLLGKRIQTLESWVNMPALKGVDRKKAEALKLGPSWASNERTIQAYLSAYYTLGNNTFQDDSEIIMDELLPSGTKGANLLSLKPVKEKFDVYSIDFAIGGQCGLAVAQTGGANEGCSQCLVPFSFKDIKPTVGFYKDPSVMTYYAIRLQAKAKLIFSPFGDVTLSAYSAAQPFGSRIGPKGGENGESGGEVAFASPQAPASGLPIRCFTSTCATDLANRIPNLSVTDSDGVEPTASTGWNSTLLQKAFYDGYKQIRPDGSLSTQLPSSLGVNEIERALQVAMVPNPWERAKYNIPNSLKDPFVKEFTPDGWSAIYAPLFSTSSEQSSANPAQEIADAIHEMEKSGNGNQTTKSIMSPATVAALTQQIVDYVNGKLVSGAGEDGEGINVVRIRDSEKSLPESGSSQYYGFLPQSIYLRGDNDNALKIKTSWNDVLSNSGEYDYKRQGRSGYSVKYVPLGLLKSPNGITTDGSAVFNNRLPASGDAGADLEKLEH